MKEEDAIDFQDHLHTALCWARNASTRTTDLLLAIGELGNDQVCLSDYSMCINPNSLALYLPISENLSYHAANPHQMVFTIGYLLQGQGDLTSLAILGPLRPMRSACRGAL